MDTNASQVLSSARSIVVVLPASPRLDLAAAGLSFARSLQKSGKTVDVICPTPITVDLSRLVGVEKVSDRLGNKNLLIRFTNYDAGGIDTVTYNVENNQFELVVATKDGAVPPTSQQVEISYSGLNADVVVLVGSTDPNQFGKLNTAEIFQSSKLAYLGIPDAQASPPLLFSLTDSTAASLSEIVTQFLENQQFPLDQDLASNLLFGIEAATNNFQSQATTAGSFAAAAICLRHGAIRHSQEVSQIRGSPQQNQWRPRPGDRGSRPPRPYIPPPVTPPPTPPVQPQPVAGPPPAETPSVSVPNQPTPPRQEPPSPEWLEPKIYTGRTIV